MTVSDAIKVAEEILPGVPAPEGDDDPRWKAIIAVGEHIETDPEDVWKFSAKWGSHSNEDLRMAVATCLLEHLLEHHFEKIFPCVKDLAMQCSEFAWTFKMCAKFGQSEKPENSKRIEELKQACSKKHTKN